MDNDLTRPDRRALFGGLALVGSMLVTGAVKAEGTATTKIAAWLLGDNLSLAGLLYAQGSTNAQDTSAKLFAKSEKIANAVGLLVKPFPPRAKTTSATYADVLHYLIKGDGALLGAALAKKYGKDRAILYELSVKSNLLILLYAPGEDSGISKVIVSRSNELGLPKPLWTGLVEAIEKKQKPSDVKDLVFKMHKDVAEYLVKS